MPATFIVGKPFERNGVVLEPGAAVDVTGWRNVEVLVKNRYLRPTGEALGTPRICIVGKPFSGYKSGELVDTAAWPNADGLVASRFLRPATDHEIDAATAPPANIPVPTPDKRSHRRE